MKSISKKCAMCGEDRIEGSTLCEDCIVACGGVHGNYKIEVKCLMEMFKDCRKVAERDVTSWTIPDILKLVNIEVFLMGRHVTLNGVNISKYLKMSHGCSGNVIR